MNNRITGLPRRRRRSSCILPRGWRRCVDGWQPGRIGLAWRDDLPSCAQRWPDVAELDGAPGINPNVLMHQIRRPRSARPRRAYVADVGQHQMWAAQSIELRDRPAIPDIRRHGGDGVRAACGHRRRGRLDRASGRADRRRRRLPAQHPGAADRSSGTAFRSRWSSWTTGCHGMVRQFQQSYFERAVPVDVLGLLRTGLRGCRPGLPNRGDLRPGCGRRRSGPRADVAGSTGTVHAPRG